MKKYIKFLLSVSLALCMVIGLGATIACNPNNNTDDDKDTFTIIVKNEDGTPAAEQWVQYCSDGEGAQCYPKRTDSNGKVTVDISTTEWQNSETIHVLVYNLPADYSVYDENGNVCDYDSDDDTYGIFIDHHEIKSVTLTIKQDPTFITESYEYEESFLGGESKKYFTVIRNASEAVFEADIQEGEFELSVVVDSNAPKTEILSSSNKSVVLDLGEASFFGINVLFTLKPKTNAAATIKFAVCPVLQLGDKVNIYGTDLYKVYFNLPNANTELAFEMPGEDPFGGFPITVKIGSQTFTWTETSDIAPVSTTETGYVPFTFTFADADTANLYLIIKDANAPSTDGDVIVLGETIEIELSTAFGDDKQFTFTAEETETYIITVTGGTAAKVMIDIVSTSTSSGWLNVSEYENGIIEYEFPAGVEVTITFGTDNESGDSYSVVVSKKAR
ncbi:MAG: hypothetical protein J1G07_06810 [Clostridiales bacterium]|nr:hypothetical protein [Clostridiales bacterium]